MSSNRHLVWQLILIGVVGVQLPANRSANDRGFHFLQCAGLQVAAVCYPLEVMF